MVKKEDIVDIIKSFDGRNNIYTVYTDWVKMSACAIHNATMKLESLENEYKDIAAKYNKEELKRFSVALAMLYELAENKYDDYLGSMYMMLESSSKRTGQFFTPYHISQMLARVAAEPKIENERLLISEPSCGAGANIIAFLEYCQEKGINYQMQYNIVAQDIDWNCVYMCYVQLSIYGVYGSVVQGDTLASETQATRHTLYTPMYHLQRGCVN